MPGLKGVRGEPFRFLVDFEPLIAWCLKFVVLESDFLGSNPGSTPYWQSDSRQAHQPLDLRFLIC